VERAILWGFDVSHIDAHMGTLQMRPEFFDIYLELAIDFALPLRMVGAQVEGLLGFPAAELARSAGAIFSDRSITLAAGSGRAEFQAMLDALPRGVTELHLRPAVDSSELRAVTGDWEERVDDYELLCGAPNPRQAAEKAGVTVIGFRPLRELIRSR
jgi:hypothetical protein